jgi:nucleoside-diphosphate-sugar epimerase
MERRFSTLEKLVKDSDRATIRNSWLLPGLPNKITEGERFLILGANGWFGRTMKEMLSPKAPLLRIGRKKTESIHVWDSNLIKDFAPTIVLNFAFLTRNKLRDISRDSFIETNLSLIKQMKIAAQLPTVKKLLTVSSGAALDTKAQQDLESEEIYGALKRIEERDSLDLSGILESVVVLRTYSISGPFFPKNSPYAFSSLVEAASLGKELVIHSPNVVFRRYCALGDLLAVGLWRLMEGWSGVIESGGDLVELGELARLIGELLGTPVRPREISSLVRDDYYSDNKSWIESISAIDFTPLHLEEQILSVSKYLRAAS